MTRTKTPPTARPMKAARNKNGKPPPTSDVLTLPEAAAYLRVSTDDVLAMVGKQGLPGRQFGAEWRFLKTALQAWLGVPAGRKGLLAQLGKAEDDPYLEEMLAEIYRRRGRPEVEPS